MKQSNYTEEQKAAYRAKLRELAEQLQERLRKDNIEINTEIHDEWTLPRFLRARGLDVDAAYEMFTRHLKWREETGADTILETAPKTNKNFELVKRYWPGRFFGVDKDGCPVYYERIGSVDVRGLVSTVPAEDLINFHIWQQEHALKIKRELSKKEGRSMYGNIVVEDLAGLSMGHTYTPAFDLFTKVISSDQANYPDTLKAYYVINPPSYLSMLFNLVKPFLDNRTKEKVKFLKKPEELLQVIDADNLPAEYGGTCMIEGGCIPGGGPFVDRKEDGTSYNPIQATVSRRDTLEVKLSVEAGATVGYEFASKGYDIGFALFFSADPEGQQERKTLLELKLFPSDETVQGQVTAPATGTVVFVWDNTHSMLKSKTITYQLFIQPPPKLEDSDEERSSA